MNSQATLDPAIGSEIAIIGMAGRFPGAANVDEFWRNLRDGVESISFFSDEELEAAGVPASAIAEPNYIKAGAVLDDVELFDADFFGMSPREAELTDPQHRLFLECAWEALENAGHDSATYPGRIGVYAGVDLNTYLLHHLFANAAFRESLGFFRTALASDKDFLSTRVSYKLNLKGPSLTVQTACSTSLVAVHLACQSLLNGECDMALAGGVSISIPQKVGYVYQRGMIVSPDGHCRAFDAQAQGTLGGSGLGIVILKRLSDALTEGDTIHAVIKGSAVNNDGSSKIGYTAPSVSGQSLVIAEALAVAGVEPDTISYVETHGTGTPLGDPIEMTALTQAFRSRTKRQGFCAVGSLKTNIGHLSAASGVAGLIKTVEALKHKQLPPSLNFEQPNPEIDFARSPFYVNTCLTDWPADGVLRRAGVSSFGIGGTNAHIVLEEAPSPSATDRPTRPWQLLLFSARTEMALDKMTANLAASLRRVQEQPSADGLPVADLADVAYTLQVGRRVFDHRRMVVCRDLADAVTVLEARDPQRVLGSVQETRARPIAFMFSGVGDQYVNMAAGLHETEPVFRTHFDRCAAVLKPYLGLDLREVVYPGRLSPIADQPPTAEAIDLRRMLGRGQPSIDEATNQLNQTFLVHPALFSIEYALAQLVLSWGVVPQAMIGHSLGEYVAACLAGVLSLEDALTLVVRRAQMVQALPHGAMLAVPLSEGQVQPLLGSELSMSAINGPSLSVLAGPEEPVAGLERTLLEQGIACRRVSAVHAFHSQLMEPLREPFARLVGTVHLKPPAIPYISNLTGTWMTPEQATDPNYWSDHLCRPVRFADGVRRLWQDPECILLEIGPGQTLSTFARQCSDDRQTVERVALPTLPHAYDRRSDVAFLLGTLGELWLSGQPMDWTRLHTGGRRRRTPLPTYPFERQRYWIGSHPSPEAAAPQSAALDDPLASSLYNRPNLHTPYVAPSTEIERQVAEIWQKLLGVAQIGVHDNFFQLGGDSLLGTMAITQLRQKFQVDLPLRALLEAPTVAGVAVALEDTIMSRLDELSEEEVERLGQQLAST